MPFPEAEGCFRGFSGPAILAQPGPPALGVQPELWERHCGGAPGLPLHAPLAGQYGPVREGRKASLVLLTQHTIRTAMSHSSVNARVSAVVTAVRTNSTRQTWTQTSTQGWTHRDIRTETEGREK